MRNRLEMAAICCLLLVCETGEEMGSMEEVSIPTELPTATPMLTVTSTPIPTSTFMPWPTCTSMSWPTDTPVPEIVVIGRASQYAEGVMERVIGTRQRLDQIPQDVSRYDGYVAARECNDIGRVIYLRSCDTTTWEMFLIVDCASKADRQSETDDRSGYEWMQTENVWFEIDYQTAVRWNTVRRMACIEIRR